MLTDGDGGLFAHGVAAALAPSLGRADAELPEVSDGLGPEGLDAALDPASYLGVDGGLIDRARAVHRAG
jgi:hypothetical protein